MFDLPSGHPYNEPPQSPKVPKVPATVQLQEGRTHTNNGGSDLHGNRPYNPLVLGNGANHCVSNPFPYMVEGCEALRYLILLYV